MHDLAQDVQRVLFAEHRATNPVDRAHDLPPRWPERDPPPGRSARSAQAHRHSVGARRWRTPYEQVDAPPQANPGWWQATGAWLRSLGSRDPTGRVGTRGLTPVHIVHE